MDDVGHLVSHDGPGSLPWSARSVEPRWRRDHPGAVELLLLAEEVCLALGVGFGEPAAETRAPERR